MHQATCKAISRCQPALLRSIAKFNTYCEELEKLRLQGCHILIPSALSTQLNGLRNNISLYEDVWITPSIGEIPRWLEDSDVHDSMRSLHVIDRCRAKEVRLKLESINMSTWLTREHAVVTAAIEALTGASFVCLIYLVPILFSSRLDPGTPTSTTIVK